ncbi:hypothetical protein [Pseudolabrys taiwanensis]|uniref:hypothetical protein n=1 Tax=Pseudolabrys taiwanensis TaxID=331696 RepID=UPI001AECC99F|nr:hypothetical protein [Pseudolabrys taiwanensis]
MTALLKYDAACRAIAEAKTVDEVTDWIDKAAAVREYGRRVRNRKLELDALEIRVQAKRRRGELLLQLKQEGRLKEGRKQKLSSSNDSLPPLTLDDLQVTANESSEDQAIAKIDGDSYRRLVARCRAYAEQHPEKHSINVLKPPPERGPVNGAGAVAHRRTEPNDSLDFSPTPPWGTRALIEKVFPQIDCRGDVHCRTAREPAAGDGHIAEVLREYFANVIASDVHEYGYADHLADFLADDAEHPYADWIITNPPFNKAEEFALRALGHARVGVAMFVRWQWLETVNRFNNLFAPNPPAIVALFSERIPLHMGRWEPDGDTMTAYCWVVWLKGHTGATRLFWIPPGQRKALEREGDRERFTAHPVIKAECPTEAAGAAITFDPSTGEVQDKLVSHPSDVCKAPDVPGQPRFERDVPPLRDDRVRADINAEQVAFVTNAYASAERAAP